MRKRNLWELGAIASRGVRHHSPFGAAGGSRPCITARERLHDWTGGGGQRTTAQTAPADLQLACASAAATSLGLGSVSVLPISSSQIEATRYQVELDSAPGEGRPV